MGSKAADCSRGDSRLLDRIEVAIDLTVQQKPAIFDLTRDAMPGSGHYMVLDPEAYLDDVVANLRAAGLCAQRDPDDGNYERIQVKDSNDYSEDFDIIASSGFIRRGGGAYRQTCTPSSFPVERAADEPPIGSGCGRPFPPPVTRFNCKVHLKGGDYYTLDSTPIVGPDCEYCASVGFTDGRCLCPVRNHGAPDRIACGFARLWCLACRTSVLCPYSCRGRSFCPSCEKKRQLLWAEWLQKEVLAPVAAPPAGDLP